MCVVNYIAYGGAYVSASDDWTACISIAVQQTSPKKFNGLHKTLRAPRPCTICSNNIPTIFIPSSFLRVNVYCCYYILRYLYT